MLLQEFLLSLSLPPQSDINKMHISNVAIVFCPTLQLTAPLFHLIYNNFYELFGNVELKKLVIQ